MDVCYSLLEDAENNQIWDRIDKQLQFWPSVRENIPFQISAPWVIHDLPFYPTGEDWTRFEETARQALASCLGDEPWCYALDWHHSGFRYNPRLPVQKRSLWVKDGRYSGGGYHAYFPSFYPDGDYYFFVQRELEWGWLGHPWRREVWLFGAPLIEALSGKLEAMGFPKKDASGGEHGT